MLKNVKMAHQPDNKPFVKPGKKAIKIAMGSTKNKTVITRLVNLVASDKRYSAFASHFESMKFETFGDCVDSFNSLIKVMEKVELIDS